MSTGDTAIGLVAGLILGFFFGLWVSEATYVDRWRTHLTEACKRSGGNHLDGYECVRIERVKVELKP